MNIYRVTFYGTNSEIFNTIIKAESLINAREIVDNRIEDRKFFEVESKNNRNIIVERGNIVFTEYELLLNNDEFKFEDIFKLDDKYLQVLLNNIYDNNLLAIMLRNVTEENIRKVKKALSEQRQILLEEEIKSLGSINISDIYQVHEVVVEIATELKKEGKIKN